MRMNGWAFLAISLAWCLIVITRYVPRSTYFLGLGILLRPPLVIPQPVPVRT